MLTTASYIWTSEHGASLIIHEDSWFEAVLLHCLPGSGRISFEQADYTGVSIHVLTPLIPTQPATIWTATEYRAAVTNRSGDVETSDAENLELKMLKSLLGN